MTRLPRGYRGVNHETISTDILALMGAILMPEPISEAGLRVLNVPAVIHQTSCFRAGAEVCRFSITSHVTDARWSGQR